MKTEGCSIYFITDMSEFKALEWTISHTTVKNVNVTIFMSSEGWICVDASYWKQHVHVICLRQTATELQDSLTQ